jgi:hypothetical protein
VQHGLPLRPDRLKHGGLLSELGLGLLARDERPEAADQAQRVETGSVDRGDARVVAGLLEQQPAVLGGDPTSRPDAVVMRGAGDVGDV